MTTVGLTFRSLAVSGTPADDAPDGSLHRRTRKLYKFLGWRPSDRKIGRAWARSRVVAPEAARG